jgi:hypothetical protein
MEVHLGINSSMATMAMTSSIVNRIDGRALVCSVPKASRLSDPGTRLSGARLTQLTITSTLAVLWVLSKLQFAEGLVSPDLHLNYRADLDGYGSRFSILAFNARARSIRAS